MVNSFGFDKQKIIKKYYQSFNHSFNNYNHKVND
jgi:hypothetical protein